MLIGNGDPNCYSNDWIICSAFRGSLKPDGVKINIISSLFGEVNLGD